MEILEQVQRSAAKMIKQLEYLPYEERLEDCLTCRRKGSGRSLIRMYKYLMRVVKKMELDVSQWCRATGQEAMGTN